MEKEQYDELYHLLRVASNTCDDEELAAIGGLVDHLFAGGNYLSLVRYSALYGEKFLVGLAFDIMKCAHFEPERIVEFGAGLGWLSRGLAVEYGISDTLTVDKRPWGTTDLVADLETEEGRDTVYGKLKLCDVIVMSDFLHCVDNPKEILDTFRGWPLIILEYMPVNVKYLHSYSKQIERYGASPVTRKSLEDMLPGKPTYSFQLDPYIFVICKP